MCASVPAWHHRDVLSDDPVPRSGFVHSNRRQSCSGAVGFPACPVWRIGRDHGRIMIAAPPSRSACAAATFQRSLRGRAITERHSARKSSQNRNSCTKPEKTPAGLPLIGPMVGPTRCVRRALAVRPGTEALQDRPRRCSSLSTPRGPAGTRLRERTWLPGPGEPDSGMASWPGAKSRPGHWEDGPELGPSRQTAYSVVQSLNVHDRNKGDQTWFLGSAEK